MNILPENQSFYFGDVTYKPGGRFGTRIQQNLQMVIVHSGDATITINGESHHLAAGHATVLLPGRSEYFIFSSTEETHHTWCDARQPVLNTQSLDKLAKLPFSQPWTSRMDRLLQLGLQTRGNSAGSESLRDRLGYALFAEYFCQIGWGDEVNDNLPEAVKKARRYIEEHIVEPLDFASIAKKVGTSPQHLARLYKQHLGVTPMHYLWTCRLQKSAQLLRHTGLSSSEIAEQCGFQNPFHFSRAIRRHFGQAPREFRQHGLKPQARHETPALEKPNLFAPTLRIHRAEHEDVSYLLGSGCMPDKHGKQESVLTAAIANRCCWIAYYGDTCAGLLLVHTPFLGFGWLDYLYVLPRWRRNGIGQSLITHARQLVLPARLILPIPEPITAEWDGFIKHIDYISAGDLHIPQLPGFTFYGERVSVAHPIAGMERMESPRDDLHLSPRF